MADMFDKEELSIVSGLFPNTLAVAEAEKLAQQEAAYKRFSGAAGTQNPFAGLAGLSGMFGTAAGQELRGLAGVQSPTTRLASLREQAAQQFDPNTPNGLAQIAQFLNQNGDSAGARQAVMLLQGQQMKNQQMATLQSQETRNLREPTRNAFSQLLAGGKYTPTSIARYQQSQNPADLVLAKTAGGEGEGGIGKPGPVGKGGAYRDISGTIFGPTEMKTVRQEFEGAQKLLDTLNQVKASDVKDAQSIIDWTTKGETKALASKKTLMAQTKIAASQLMEQINQLPPGSASDADMRASMKSFPGYSDADALAAWVNETKRKLQFNIDRGTDQFGFTARVKPTEPINLKPAKPSAGSVASDDNALINKYLTPKK